jgi:hypothetical protein
MTDLDPQALEKAYAAYDLRPSLEAAIAAYLAALPPATQCWAYLAEEQTLSVWGILYQSESAARRQGESAGRVVPVEIREVRAALAKAGGT